MHILKDLHHPEKYMKVLVKWGLLGVLMGILGGLMVRIWHFHCYGLGSFPSQETEILQAKWRKEKKSTKPSD